MVTRGPSLVYFDGVFEERRKLVEATRAAVDNNSSAAPRFGAPWHINASAEGVLYFASRMGEMNVLHAERWGS